MKKILTLMVIALALLATNRTQAQANKFGYIDMQELIAAMSDTKKADSLFTNYREALIQSEQDKQEDLNARYAKFVKDSLTMNSATKDIKRKELQDKLVELQGADQRVQELLQRKQEELSAPIQKKALDAVQLVAKEAGYTYVFMKGALLVSPPADDLLALAKKKLGIR
jgi:outer membrane protein